MAEGHGRDAWSRMSLLCALIVNAHRDPRKGRAAKMSDYTPYGKTDASLNAVVLNKDNFHLLKKAFLGN